MFSFGVLPQALPLMISYTLLAMGEQWAFEGPQGAVNVKVVPGKTVDVIVAANGRPVRAVQVGGPLGAYLPVAQFDTPFGYEEFDAKGALEAITRTKATALPGVPTMYQALLDHPTRPQRDLSSLQAGDIVIEAATAARATAEILARNIAPHAARVDSAPCGFVVVDATSTRASLKHAPPPSSGRPPRTASRFPK